MLNRRSSHSHPGGAHPTTDRSLATRRPVSSMVGDHMRIPAVVCFCFYSVLVLLVSYLYVVNVNP